MLQNTWLDPLTPGRRVGKYEIVLRLATGGMAEIYLARARGIQGFEKYVVLKRILPVYAAQESFVKMFLNEARVTATLDHPNIGNVYDIDQCDGFYFFTMEYLHGEDMRVVLKELRKLNGKLPLDVALTIAIGVASGLHAAHEKRGADGKLMGIVHRDVSPSNVVVTYDGGVKVVDFGIAKATAVAELTGSGGLKGKVAYMSPEQCRSQALDRRSDIYSLGALLYELTTQTRMFRGPSELAIIESIISGKFERPSEIVPDFPPPLEAVIMRAVNVDPDQRYVTAREMQLALEGYAAENAVVISTALLGEWMERTFGRKPEPWRATQSFPTLPAMITQDAVPPGAHEAQTRAITGIESVRRRPASSGRGKLLVAALTVLAAVAGGGVLLADRLRTHDATPTVPAPVLVMPQKGEVALDLAPGERAAPSPAPEPVVEEPRRAPEARTAIKRRAPAPAPRLGTGDAFRAIFARKEPEIERCLQGADGTPELARISIQFQADADGRVERVKLAPESFAGTKVGACVAEVARATRFGPQGHPVAVTIPITIRADRGGKGR